MTTTTRGFGSVRGNLQSRERRSSPGLCVAFRAILKYARSSRAGRSQRPARSSPSYFQHCSVRVTYSPNRVTGHWRAHGRYIERESASLQKQEAGFSAESTGVDIAPKLLEWQEGGDPRLWKLIISPEFGERLDLQRLTRDVMSRVESDLRSSLEWVAVAHFNTEHPHVHVALRGLDSRGEAFKLDRDYIKNGLRSVAQHFATVQLGYRTEQDATLALRRQVPLLRFTPLDRLVLARTQPAEGGVGDFPVTADPTSPGLGRFAATREQALASRLMTLETMGLARADGTHQWQVRRDLEGALRAMQRAADHQKTLTAHGALLSDQRLQLSAPNWRDVTSLEGRVLSHGEEENGSRFLLLEGTDGRVYYLRNTPELDEAAAAESSPLTRSSITKTVDEDGRRRIVVANLGKADALLQDRDHFRSLARRLLQHGIVSFEDERWGGWIGRYHETLWKPCSTWKTPKAVTGGEPSNLSADAPRSRN
jgi:type IV secretory pathway VirD2 relaxase